MRVLRAVLYGLWALLRVAALLALALAIPAGMLVFNLRQDAAAALQQNQYERDSAKALLAGKPLGAFNQLNERLVQQLLIENLETPFDTIAVGSSRVLQMDAEIAGVDSFYNCGLSGADYRDIMNVYYRFEKAGMLPQNLIIGLDPWILNGNADALHARSDAELFEEFITLRLGYETGWQPQAQPRTDWTEYLDPLAFRQRLNDHLHNQPELEPPRLVEGDLYSQSVEVKQPDGATLYPAYFRNSSQQEVEDRALVEATTFIRMEGYEAPDPDLRELFHRFVSYVRGQGVNVILVMMPYHPTVYIYATEQAHYYPGFFLTEPWFVWYAETYDVPLYGSYNPYVTGSARSDFYDGLHVRGDVIGSFFPGVPAVQRAMEKGTAKSPWLLEGPRVQYTVAEVIVVERYEIPPEQPVRQGDDVVVNGGLCYTVERYADDSPRGVLLARYAVSRDEGVIYRLDTGLMEWVVDRRFAPIEVDG